MIYENLSFSCLCPGVPGVGRCGKPLGIYVKKANLTNDLGLLYQVAFIQLTLCAHPPSRPCYL